MTAAAFIEAVKKMVGLPQEMLAHLVSLADDLTPEQREEAMKNLTAVYQQIEADQKVLVQEAEEGMKEVQAFRKKELPKMRGEIERKERSDADALLDDDQS